MSLDSIQKADSLPSDVSIERTGEMRSTVTCKMEKIFEAMRRIRELFSRAVEKKEGTCEGPSLMGPKKEKLYQEFTLLEEKVLDHILLPIQEVSFSQLISKDSEASPSQAFIVLCDDLIAKLSLFEKEAISCFSFDDWKEISLQSTSPDPQPVSPLPSFGELIARFKHRARIMRQEIIGLSSRFYESLSYTEKEHEYDKQVLRNILQEYNSRFENHIGRLTAVFESTGFIEKEEVQKEHKLFVRADFHGCALTFIETINMLRASGYLDETFHCVPGFFMVFLGDFMDRGQNDIELLSLLLSFKMENPHNVFLVKGNHENIDMHSSHSRESSWLISNKQLLLDTYQTWPLALFLSCASGRREKKGRREYVEFVHGFFSFAVDPMRFLSGNDKRALLNNRPAVPLRIKALAEQRFSVKDKHKKAAALFLVGREKELIFQKMAGETNWEEGDVAVPYLWGDVGCQEEFFAPSDRGAGAKVSPQGVEALRGIGSETATVRAVVRGHEHRYIEHKGSKGKVIITTLPVAPIGWEFAYHPEELSIQGLLCTLSSRVKEWGKQPVYYSSYTKTFSISQKVFGFYEELPRFELAHNALFSDSFPERSSYIAGR